MPGGVCINRESGSHPLIQRSGLDDISHPPSSPEVQERAMALAASLRRHELDKMTKKLNYLKRGNLLKFSLMVISMCSYLIFLHADFHTERYNDLIVQLGTSTPVMPSMFRVSSMSVQMNLASPVIDLLMVVMILIHHLMAAITLLLTFANTDHPNYRGLLSFNAALLFAGASICIAEIVLFGLSAQLQLQSLSSTPSKGQDDAEEPVARPLII